MPNSATPPRFNDTLLDAAEAVIFRDGIGSFTLDAVAAEANLSKGGLLHHFPSKHKLLESLVARTVACWREDVDQAIASAPEGPGRVARGLLNGCIASPDSWTEHMRRSGMVLVAAMISSNELVQPVREMHLYIRGRLASDSLAPGTGDSIALAMDGLWLGWIFGLHEVSEQRLADVRASLTRTLEAALRQAPAQEPSTSKPLAPVTPKRFPSRAAKASRAARTPRKSPRAKPAPSKRAAKAR
jgi:AcrR family transcriptional regulator